MVKTIIAIVVTHNRLGHLKNVIPLLKSQKNSNCDILVVNNGSDDGTTKWLKKDENKDLILIHQENTGGAGGFYSGIKKAYELGYQYFWLMDDDVYPSENALDELMKASDKLKNEYGFLASYVKGKNGNTINLPILDFSRNPNTNYPSWGDNINEVGMRLKMATFASILFNRDIIQQIGLPLKEFFIWCDDLEYTRRASKIQPGYFITSSCVIHKRNLEKALRIEEEEDRERIKMHYYFLRNKFYLMKTEGLRPLSIVKALAYMIYKISSVIFTSSQFKIFKSYILLKALISGLFFNPQIENFK